MVCAQSEGLTVHPRVGGAIRAKSLIAQGMYGSSPRGRGNLQAYAPCHPKSTVHPRVGGAIGDGVLLVDRVALRFIPAWAGQSNTPLAAT